MAAKIVIGLTGNIATGKSLVLRMLQELGATGIDADKLVHDLMKKGSPVYAKIVSEFGAFILDAAGEIDRRNLGKIVFTQPGALAKLEALTHPAAQQQVVKMIEQAPTPVVVVEAIKLFETDLAKLCHSKWVVVAQPEQQMRRLVERRKMPPDQAHQRVKAQSPQSEKVAKADVVIDNSGDLPRTWAIVKKHYTTLIQAPVAPEAEAPAPTAAAIPVPAVVNPDDITLRRAKRSDLDMLARMISTSTQGGIKPDVSQMMESIFSRGYIVAQAGSTIVGMAAWQAENLIAGLQDVYVARDDLWPVVGKKMLDMIHEEIGTLSCEVAMVFVMKEAGAKPIEFFQSQGYLRAESEDLGYMWEDAAREWQPENSALLYKKLREQRIMVPM